MLRVRSTTVARENVPAMEKFLAGRSYDLAYCFGLHRVSLASALPVTRARIPILWHAGGTYIVDQLVAWPKKHAIFRLLMNSLAKDSYNMEKAVDYSNIAFVSEFLRDYFISQGMQPTHPYVISRGSEFEPLTDVDRQRTTPPVFFMAARVDREKGIHNAISAAGALWDRRPGLDWRLRIAGKPGNEQYMRELLAQIAAAGIADRVKFLGMLPREKVLAEMRNATAFLSCSIYGEPFAGTIIETLASGTPLIGSADGSILEVVEPDKSGLVFEKNDWPTLSEHMEHVLDDSALRHRIALGGVNVIKDRYTLEKILDLTESVFAEVVARGPA
jgi:glycosyltransferase involved in cell wall biosynthesis